MKKIKIDILIEKLIIVQLEKMKLKIKKKNIYLMMYYHPQNYGFL